MKILIGLLTLSAIFGSFYGLGRIAIFIMDIGAKPEHKWENIPNEDQPSTPFVGFIVAMFLALVIILMHLVGSVILKLVG